MKKAERVAEPIAIDRVFLDLSNPRHNPYTTEAEAIEYLCREEQVYALARDIGKIGLNPLEAFALIPIAIGGRRTTQSYVVAEGNRRLCALKLLHDPELAPANLRKDFAKLAEKSISITRVPGIIFKDQAEFRVWRDRIHGGPQGGIGRRSWNPEQKGRHAGVQKNAIAQGFLDYAEEKGFISAKARKGKLTTAQRYLSNPLLREAIGVDATNLEDLARNRPEPDFDVLVKRFTSDLVSGVVSSRKNKEDIEAYSRSLTSIPGLSAKRITSESLNENSTGGKRTRRKPRNPQRPKHIRYEEEVYQRLKDIPSYKLERIYYSLCEIGLEDHTPLIAVGAWSFLESLTARCGRSSGTAFPDFLSKSKLNSLGFTEKEKTSSISQVLHRISGYGNTTKHHEASAFFNGEQLANDMDAIKEVIIKLAEQAKLLGH